MALQALHDLPAPAKLNLFLHVLGRRPDGYHLLQSVFVLVDWADTLHIERRNDSRLQRHDLGAALPAEDLCLSAARLLQEASGCTWGADIHIAKQVPWGAGMGGGSSDAATTLLALNRLWQLNWPRQRLLALGLRLGADVPFFVGGRNAFVEGIGEQLTPLHEPAASYAVVKPPAAIATADIFGHPLLVRDTKAATLMGSFDGTGAKPWPAEWTAEPGQPYFGRNDLQAPAEQVCVQVAQAARWLEARYGNSRMTGSGSAVFAIANGETGLASPPMATFPADELPPGWVGRLCRGLDEHPLRGWAAD